MPRYKIQDPDSGRVITVEGESPPTEQDLDAIFSEAARMQPAQENVPKNKKEPEWGFGGTLKGIAETGATVAAGAAGSVAAGLEGLGRIAASPFTGESLEDVTKAMEKTIHKLGYEPSSPEANAIIDSVSVPLQWLDEQTFRLGTVAEDIPVIGPAVATGIKVGADAALGFGAGALMKKGFRAATAAKVAKAEMQAANNSLITLENAAAKGYDKLPVPGVMESTREMFRQAVRREIQPEMSFAEKRALMREADDAWSAHMKAVMEKDVEMWKAEDAALKANLAAGKLPPAGEAPIPPDPKLPLKDLKEGGRSVKDFVSDLSATVITKLDGIDPTRRLSTGMRRMEQMSEMKMVYRNARLEDFYKISEKMYDSKYSANWHEAYLKQDWARLQRLAEAEGIALKNWKKTGGSVYAAMQEAKNIIKEIGDEAVGPDGKGGVGFKGFVREPDYLPRHIDNRKWSSLKKDPAVQELVGKERSLSTIDEASYSDEFMRMDAYNKLLLKGGHQDINRPTPSQTFKRAIINPERTILKNYYEPLHVSMKRYVDDVTEAIEIRRFLGNDTGNLDQSLGNYIKEAQLLHKLNPDQADTLRRVLRARFNEGRQHPHRLVQNLKNTGYIFSIGNVWSTLTQLGDIVSSARRLGLGTTARGLKGAFSKEGIRVTDVGYDDIMKELASPSKTAKWLDSTLRYSGFKKMDRFGKNTIVNSARIKWQKHATTEKGLRQLEREYGPMFRNNPAEFDKFVADLADGNIANPNVKLVIFNELADLQPITLSDMPIAYLNNPNGRWLYALKTWTAQQWNTLYRDTVGEYRLGRLEGKGRLGSSAAPAKNLLKFATYNVILGTAGIDTMKQMLAQLLAGEDLTADKIPDNVANGFLKTVLLSSYGYDHYVKGGDFWGAISNVTAPAISSTATRIVQAAKKEDEEKYKALAQNLPIIGAALRAIEKAKEEE